MTWRPERPRSSFVARLRALGASGGAADVAQVLIDAMSPPRHEWFGSILDLLLRPGKRFVRASSARHARDMIQLNDEYLAAFGLDCLPDDARSDLLRHIYETLEMRVGARIASTMTESQMDEFEALMEAGDETGALAWLESNAPHYQDAVREEHDHIRAELRDAAPAILEAEHISA